MLEFVYFKILKVLRKLYSIANPESSSFGRQLTILPMKEYANDLIYKALISDQPVMIGRLGSTELICMTNYIGVKNSASFKNKKTFIQGKTPGWLWQDGIIKQMQNWSGFFPPSIPAIEQFCEQMINDLPSCDILGSWLKEENFFAPELSRSKKVLLEDLEPLFSINPWTRALEGKNVLIVHPFAETIQVQYLKKNLIFPDGLLPEFNLLTIKAVQSIAGEPTVFSDWFEALNWMKNEIEKVDFDICILGCGAYGFPLAAHIKRMGKKAVHLGGVTQLLFGIKGKRWENYLFYPYANLYNEHWVRPRENDKPKNADIVEGACYW